MKRIGLGRGSLLTVLLICLATLGAAAAQGSDQASRIARNEIIIGFQSDAQSLDPRRARITPDLRVTTLIHNGLLRATSGGLVGDLAESWEIPDLSTYIFHLREGVTFHNGSPLTSEDVKFTYDTIRDPAFASPDLGTFSIISEVETPDPLTVIFRLSQPSVALLAEFNRGIVSKGYAEADPAAANLAPIGTGPYSFVEWVPNTHIILDANPAYHRGAPGFSRITFVPITDNTVRALRLETGAIDVMWNASPAEMRSLRQDSSIQVFELSGSTADFVQINTCTGPLSDVRVRQAVMHAIDQQEIADGVYFGGVLPGASPIVPSSAFHDPTAKQPSYDPERARQLLSEAGYPNGLTLQLEHLASVTVQQYSLLLQEQLARAGITLELLPREAATIIRDWSEATYQMISFGLGNRFDPDNILYPRYHSSRQVPNGNNTCYSNPEVDRLLDAARAEPEFEVRKQLYSEVQQIIVEEVPILILSYLPEYLAAPARMTGLTYDPFSLFYYFAVDGSWGN